MTSQDTAATRMNFLQVKNQQVVAKRGHKLLKDKQDSLIKELLRVIKRAKTLRAEIQTSLSKVAHIFLQAQAFVPDTLLQSLYQLPLEKVKLSVKTQKVMSVGIPVFEAKKIKQPLHYSPWLSRGELDEAILLFNELLEKLITLAEIEKSAENLAVETQKTRQRVNALENYLLPEISATLKTIRMKLGEMERESIVRVMAIKNMRSE